MGRAKEMYEEKRQQERDERLAKLLGITYEELSETDFSIELTGSEDSFVRQPVVYFKDCSPRYILDKIDGLDENNRVWLSPGDLDDEEDYGYEE